MRIQSLENISDPEILRDLIANGTIDEKITIARHNYHLSEENLIELAMDGPELAHHLLCRPSLPIKVMEVLLNVPNIWIKRNIANRSDTPDHILRKLAYDYIDDFVFRIHLRGNKNTPEDVVLFLNARSYFLKSPLIGLAQT